MDTITHALSGALLAIAMTPGRSPSDAKHRDTGGRPPDALSQRARIAAGAAAAAFPDIDFALRAIDTLTYLNLHQGVTHSLIMLPVWALLLAWLFALLSRQRYRWSTFYGIAAMGLAIHIGGDLITAYGTQILAPFSSARFSWPLLFVIDLFVTGILIAGLVAARYQSTRRLAPIAFLLLAGYLGVLVVLQQRAIEIGADYARAQRLEAAGGETAPAFSALLPSMDGEMPREGRSPERPPSMAVGGETAPAFSALPPSMAVGGETAPAFSALPPSMDGEMPREGRSPERPPSMAVVSHALPQPLSPFHWLVIVQHGDDYYETRLNLAGGQRGSPTATAGFFERLAASFQPVAAATWTHRSRYGVHPAERALARPAYAHEAFTDFRRFARYLVLDHVESHRDRSCVWFSDLRFGIPGLPPSFRYGLCRHNGLSNWQLVRWRGSFYFD